MNRSLKKGQSVRRGKTDGRSVERPFGEVIDRLVARLLCANGVRDFRSGTRKWHGEVVWIVNDKRTVSITKARAGKIQFIKSLTKSRR